MQDNIINIGVGSFKNCTSLTDVTLSNELTYLSASTFESCSSLKELQLPDKITKLGDYCFI